MLGKLLVLLASIVFSSRASTFDKHFPSSCQDPSIIEDGEYYIYPDGLSPVLVYCDVSKGGWATVFNKADKSDFFNRTWTDYVYGFGEPRSNYWAGLLNIRNLVLTEPMVLRIELSNSARDEFYIEYESFFIDSAEHQYLLKVGNKTAGNLVDTFSNMSNAKFFAHDKDVDGTVSNNTGGGWWYYNNGEYLVCLTCSPHNASLGNWHQHGNWLTFSRAKMMLKAKHEFRPSNCHEIMRTGGIKLDGIYNIYLDESGVPTRVFCEMKKGGWTRVLNRINRLNSSFDRVWTDYKEGFGDLVGNYWIGLKALQALTYQQQMSLRIEVASDDRDEEFIEYPTVLIYPESQRFKLVLSSSNRGTLYDWMSTIHNGQAFYTKDDDSALKCATDGLGGWWFNPTNCYRVCLTCAKLTVGQYAPAGSDPSNKLARKNFMKMLIRPALTK